MAGRKIGEAFLRVRPDTSTLGPELSKKATAAGQGFGRNFAIGTLATLVGNIASTQVFNTITGVITGGFSGAVTAASDLGESMNAVNKIFGTSAARITAWGKTNATSFGLSQRAFNALAVPLGAMLRNSGLSMKVVEKNTIDLTTRAADMASVFNTDVSEALEAIQAGLRGESDPLERFGVGLSAAKVEAQALATTGKKTAEALTAQELTLARLKLIFDQTATSAGDFRGTADGLANAQRIAAAKTEELQAKLGTRLMPVMQAVTRTKLQLATVLTSRLLPVVDRFGAFLSGRVVPAVRDLAARWLPPLRAGLAQVATTFGNDIQPRITALAGTWLPRLAATFGAIASVVVNDLIPGIVSVVSFFARHETLTKTLAIAIGTLVVVTKLYAASLLVTIALTKIAAAGGLLKFIAAAITSTSAWTAVQWLLNLAMTANPIGVVIVAVGLLVAAIVFIATKTQIFQTVWRVSWTAVKNAAQAVASWFSGPFVGFFRRAWAALAAPVVFAVAFWKAKLAEAVAFFKGLPGRILAALGNLRNLLVNAGKDIVEGLWNGIKSLSGWLADKVRGFIASNVPGPVRKLLGISSPSKLFEGFGRDTILGFARGVHRAQAALRGLAPDLGGAALAAVAGPARTRMHPADIAAIAHEIARVIERRPVQLYLDGRRIDYSLGDRASRLSRER